MVKRPLNVNERGNPLLPLHGLLFSISSKESIICTNPHTTNTTTDTMPREDSEKY